MANGIQLAANRLAAYALHKNACKLCCDFLGNQFSERKSLEGDIEELRHLVSELSSIQIDINEIEIGDTNE